MDITKLSRLFSADLGQVRRHGGQSELTTEADRRKDTDAVKISGRLSLSEASFRSQSDSRAQRIADLKNQVQQGTYRQPDSTKLAQAVAKELFIV
jgi:anti-sigma28 factor (negative regulator of flagellin synthesis)